MFFSTLNILLLGDVFTSRQLKMYLPPWIFNLSILSRKFISLFYFRGVTIPYTRIEDKELFIWSYKKTREYARRMKCYRGEFPPYHPVFPEGSNAACKENALPVPVDTPDIVYTKEDDKAIWKYLQAQCKSFIGRMLVRSYWQCCPPPNSEHNVAFSECLRGWVVRVA